MTDVEYILAGESTFTLQHEDGQPYTYKVRQLYQIRPDPETAIYYVQLLCGPQNGLASSYRHLGTISRGHYHPGDTGGHRRPGRQSPIRESAPSAKIFEAYWIVLMLTGRPLPGWQLHKSARCCRCGRLLTVPESVTAGIGPVCAVLS